MVHNAAVVVQHHLRRLVSAAVSLHHRHRMRFPRRHQCLHVYLWRSEVVLAVPLRSSQVGGVHHRCAVHDPDQSRHREHRGALGRDDKQAQVLRGAEGDF